MSNEKLKPSRATITRTAVLFIALINQVIVIYGGEALPFTDSQIYEAVSTVLTVYAALASWWHNNSFSSPALQADLKLEAYKHDKATHAS